MKRIFISFAKEDSNLRDLLVGQAKNNHSPFEFVDLLNNHGIMHGKQIVVEKLKVAMVSLHSLQKTLKMLMESYGK